MDEGARVLNLNTSLSQPNETYFTFETLLFEIRQNETFILHLKRKVVQGLRKENVHLPLILLPKCRINWSWVKSFHDVNFTQMLFKWNALSLRIIFHSCVEVFIRF